MPKPNQPRPATELDNRQLDLPLFAASADEGVLAPPAVTAPPRPDSTPGGVKLRRLTLSGRTLEYGLKRSSRRTIGFSIDGSGLMITAPRWVTLADIETAIAGKERWIFAKLAEWQTRVEQRALPRVEWRDGAEIPYLGKPVRVEGTITEVCAMKGCWMELAEGEAKIRVKVEDDVIAFPISSRGKIGIAEGVLEAIPMTREKYVEWQQHLAEERGQTFDAATVGDGPYQVLQVRGTGAKILDP